MHVPMITLNRLLEYNWKIYCFGNCSFETETCEQKVQLVNATMQQNLNVYATTTLIMDSGSDDSTECNVPFELTHGRKLPAITFFDGGDNDMGTLLQEIMWLRIILYK